MSLTLRIAGGVAVITGAASGIGRGLAQHAASLKMKLVLADINQEALAELAATLNTQVLCVTTDVRDATAVDNLAEQALAHFGEVDLVFNNAGILSTGLSWEIPPSQWQREFAVNVHGVLNGIHAFVPRLLKAKRRAHIINTASVGGFLPSAMMSPYTASKAAVVAITESLQAEMQITQSLISVSLLAPGPVQSAIFNDPFTTGSENGDQRVREFTLMLREMITQHGMNAEAFAAHVFAGIAEQRFWILPQPELLDQSLQKRVDSILAQQNPPISWS